MEEPEIPPTLQRLWARGAPPRRGPKPTLSADRIVRSAVEIADAEGLAAVSMARVAEALGCTSMALYRHVANKDELLALMADAVAGEFALPPTVPGDWRAGLDAWTRAQVEAVMDRPWFLDLPLPTMRLGPNRLRWIDAAFEVLAGVPLDVGEKLQVIGLLAQYLLGEGRVQVETRRAAIQLVRREQGLADEVLDAEIDERAIAAANTFHDFETVLVRLADPQGYPHLFEALGSGLLDAAEDAAAADDQGFEVSLQIVLDGVATFIEARGKPAAG